MSIIKTPNLPEYLIKGVLVDYRTPFSAVKKLSDLGITVYKTTKCQSLYTAVDGHPDMVFCHVGDNSFICAPICFEYYKKMFPMLDIICGKNDITGTYPYDIAYNVARVGEYAICNMEYTDRKIIEYLDQKDIKIINVKQGYSKCSVCVVDRHSIITSDKGIAYSIGDKLDVLLIKEGFINLPGLNHGFIGGCCGKIDIDKLAVCGDLAYHADFEAITEFCKERQVEIISIQNEHLFDIGSIIPVY